MNETNTLVEKITEGIQEKKGKKIIIADLTGIEDRGRHKKRAVGGNGLQ